MKKKKINSNNLLLLITIVLFFVMYAAGCIVYADKGFTRFQTFLNILINNAGLICITAGMTCVMLTGGIDISVGSVVGLSGIIVSMCMLSGMGVMVSILIAILASVLVGLFNGVLVFDANVPPFIATMASMTIVRNIILLITGAKTISGLPKGFTAIAAGSVFGVPNLFLAWFAIILMSFFISKKTVFGRNIYSYGSNKEAARLSGINTRVTVYGVYVFCAVVCGIAGILLTSRLGNGVPTSGDGYELDAIAAAVVGGASLDGGEGSVIGTVLGAMIMAMLRQGGTLLGINSFIMEIIIGSLIALAVVIDKIRRR